MSSTLITTKLYTPKPRGGSVPRPGLLDHLDTGLKGKLTLISASSGYGKTTLMTEWCSSLGREYPLAWVSLDKGDNDPVGFFSYMIAALQNIQKGLGQDSSAMLQGAQNPLNPTIITLLINELSAVPNDFALVLEDYHTIESHEIHQMMGFLLEHLPPRMHVLILTRSDPPFPLARMRARGELTEIRAKDLRFTLTDATTLLHDVAGVGLSEQDVQTLLDRTEGWVTGLQLAALSIQGNENPSELITAFGGGNDYIVDYLIEEVLERQPDDRKLFLLQTSILSRLNGPLCEEITGLSDGEGRLEQLEKENLFVSPLGGENRWYRYHRLFADVMQNRLQRTSPDQIPELHLRAARWFERNYLYTEAIDHALSAHDFQYAGSLVEGRAMELLNEGAVYTLLGWLKKFPEEAVASRPWLCVLQAWSLLLTGKLELLERYLGFAEKQNDQLEDKDDLQGNIAAIRAYALALQGNAGDALEQANRALSLLTEESNAVRSLVAFVLGGILYLQGDFPGAMQTFKEASLAGEQAGNLHVAVPALCSLADLLIKQGDIAQAENAFQRAISLGGGKNGRPLPIAASAYSGLADLHLMRKELDTARQYAILGVELAEKWGQAESLASGFITLAKVELAEGNRTGASQAIQQAEQIASSHSMAPNLNEEITTWKSNILNGPVAAASQWPLTEILSERELEVLRLFADGLSNQEVANTLIISLGTVKAHSSNIYRKLDVRNRAQAVIAAQEMKLLK